jgi:hypothetical protein
MSRSIIAIGAVFLSSVCFESVSFAQYSGVDGCNPGPCANAVPCRHCTGTWYDNLGSTLNLVTTLSTNTASGSVTIPGEPGCPNIVFQVSSGSLTPIGGTYPYIAGTTQVYLHATNPNPSGQCGGYTPVNFTLNVQIRNDGCDIAAGTAQNDDGTFYYSAYSMAKVPDKPTGETTQFVGSWSVYPTIGQFRQTLQGTYPFDGRQVTEGAGTDHVDGCFYQGAADHGYPPFRVTGAWWIIGRYATPPLYPYSNYWIDDYVGMTTDLVTFYRQNGRVPCDAYAQQVMKICTNGQGCPFTQQYFPNYLTYEIQPTYVVVSRNGQYTSITWP